MNPQILHQGGQLRQTMSVEYMGTTLAGAAIAVDLAPGMVLARAPKANQNTRNNRYTRPEASTLDSHLVKVVSVPPRNRRGSFGLGDPEPCNGFVEVTDFDPEGDVLVLGDFSSVSLCVPVANQFYVSPAAAIDGASISVAEQATMRAICGKFVDTPANEAAAVLRRVEFNGRRG